MSIINVMRFNDRSGQPKVAVLPLHGESLPVDVVSWLEGQSFVAVPGIASMIRLVQTGNPGAVADTVCRELTKAFPIHEFNKMG